MKRPPLIRRSAALLLSIAFAGCANFPPAQKTGQSAPAVATATAISPAEDLNGLRTKLADTTRQLENTIGCLARLPNTGKVSESYIAFNDSQAAFVSAAESMLEESAKVRNNGAAYFEQWRDHTLGILDADIKAVADQRRIFLEQRYNAMLPPLVTLRADLKTFATDTSDLLRALAYDQTEGGVVTIAPLIKRTVERGETALESLKALMLEVDSTISLLPPSQRTSDQQ